jgi:hypothetical protein
MSRSRRKTPARGITTADSEKSDKVKAHRKLRRAVRIAIDQNTDALPQEKEVSNKWTMAKDGKGRFDPGLKPELMRK